MQTRKRLAPFAIEPRKSAMSCRASFLAVVASDAQVGVDHQNIVPVRNAFRHREVEHLPDIFVLAVRDVFYFALMRDTRNAPLGFRIVFQEL